MKESDFAIYQPDQHSLQLGITSGRGVDLDATLERLGGDWDLLRDVCEIFLLEAPGLINAVRNAIACHNAHALERAAHSLKGAISALGDHDCVDAALQLERMGRDGKIDVAAAVFRTMAEKMGVLTASVQSLQQRLVASQDENEQSS